MISRRTALRAALVVGGVGAAGVGAQAGGVLDDGLRAVGVQPHAEPDPREVALLSEAARDQADLIAAVTSLSQGEHAAELAPLLEVLSEQRSAVSADSQPSPAAAGPAVDVEALADQLQAAAAARADGALAASSLAVIKVLAAMAAGLDQVAVAVRRLA